PATGDPPPGAPPRPDHIPEFPIKGPWLRFTHSLRILLVVEIDDRPLDQYLVMRDTVLALVESEDFLTKLHEAWLAAFESKNYYPQAVADGLLMELKAFPTAVEVATATEDAGDNLKSKWWKKLIGRGSTTAGSFKDLFDAI